jgi:hypothetical protein
MLPNHHFWFIEVYQVYLQATAVLGIALIAFGEEIGHRPQLHVRETQKTSMVSK